MFPEAERLLSSLAEGQTNQPSQPQVPTSLDLELL